jgi:hypothetical protein
MLVRRRTWLYQLPGEREIHSISFKTPLTLAQVKVALQRTVGSPAEIWGRSVGPLTTIER